MRLRNVSRDQAETLRRLAGTPTVTPRKRRRMIAVTGGKGGVGKSSISVNLAASYARRGDKTLLVDGDLGMADLNLLLGVAPRRTVSDLVAGASIEDILVEAHGFTLLPALNGSAAMAQLGDEGRSVLLSAIDQVSERFDAIVIDTAAGIAKNVTDLVTCADDVVVVVTPEPTSIADAYGCLKVLSTRMQVRKAYVVTNAVRSIAEAEDTLGRLAALVARFLDLSLVPLPAVPFDRGMSEAAAEGIPCVLRNPEAPSSRALRQLVEQLEALCITEEQSMKATSNDLSDRSNAGVAR